MTTTTQTVNPSAALIGQLNAANSSLAAGSNSVNTSTSMQNTFMTLLTTQLKNQDPLNPMDSAQMTSQLAQINTVSGINQLNTTLQALNNSMSASSAANMIGRGVLVPGSTINLSNGSAVGGVQLTQPVDNMTITVKDAAGNVVDTMNMGAQQAGVIPFSWDGNNSAGTALASGAYTVSVQASTGGQPVAATALSYGLVNAVTLGTQGGNTMLDIPQLGPVNLSSVMMVM
jgi:flagellar basal-body rod modification protein FlgD